MNNRAVIYARLSREDEYKFSGQKEESTSIENQIDVLTQYCSNNGFKLVEIYYDDGYSGGTLERPGIQALLNDMLKKKFDIVIVKDISRLGRSLHKVGNLIDNVFPENNIRLISVNDHYDSQTYHDEYSIVLRNFLNDYYLKECKKKSLISIKFRSENKHMSYFPKYGYKFNEEGQIIIDEESSKVVKLIFDLVALKEMSCIEVADYLNEHNIETKSQYTKRVYPNSQGKKQISEKWDRHAVRDTVRDYEYCGHSINLERKKERFFLRDTHQAIIDEELFQKAQAVVNKNKKQGRHGTYNHIGSLMKSTKIGYRFTYAPRREKKKSSACYACRGINSSINAEFIHEIVFKECVKIVKSCKRKPNAILDIYKKKATNIKGLNFDVLRTQQNKLNEMFQIVLEQFFKGDISNEEYEEKSKELQEKINDVESKIKQTETIEKEAKKVEVKLNKFLSRLDEIIQTKDRIDFIKKVVDCIYVNDIKSPTNFDITIKFKFE